MDANGLYYNVKRRSNRNGGETLMARGLSLEAAAELAFRFELLQIEHGGVDEFFVELY
jgi:hypothetical protein